ncbi:DNA-binding response regulator, NarL/FixJ family, contains REC and HTH domains [Marivirga sericea]|uniref:DNA-binding response regulator, NarL/FixJ family, contains REC and HTH domains n=1 Tax=Marivirga sericea TaxID=1028 RepID=A0A1X7K5D8_9BACT|nr:response regulator transcription factor [Marivirga sericea]SMG36247.1 DNA-binding response regulator, NarL/FixJ family, contains REC and HTH domains [Marivirga sericea]
MFKKKVIIIEDQDDLRDSFELIVNGTKKFRVLKTYIDGESAVAEVHKTLPDIAMVDLELPGINGIETIKIIKEKSPKTECIIVTVYDDPNLVFKALKAGAAGYIIKDANYLEIIDSLIQLDNGGAPMSPQIARIVIQNFHINEDSPLSKRETEVLELISEGKSYFQISEELFISKDTARSHIRNIYIKLNVNSKSAALAKAKKDHLI